MKTKHNILTYSLIVFDADGTLTPKRKASTDPFVFSLNPNVAEVCKSLTSHGITLAIASNQNSKRAEEDIAEQLHWTAREIGATYVVWATTPERRKPNPAMLDELSVMAGIHKSKMLFVGDDDTDRLTAEAFGCDFCYADKFFEL